DAQVLVSELAVRVTGPEPIHPLIDQLRERSPAAAVLAATRDHLAAIDASPLGVPAARYQAIASALAALPAEIEPARLFQVDLAKASPEAILGGPVLRAIADGVALLHRLAPPGDSATLRRFREAFRERYEEAELPLAEVLDEESGIGFARSNAPAADAPPLLEGLAFPAAPGEETAPWRRRESHLLRRLEAAARTGAQQIDLEEPDLEALAQERKEPL